MSESKRSKKSAYPSNEGWIRLEATMTSSMPVGVERVKQIAACGGDPEKYEFGPMVQYGRKIKVIYRQKLQGERIAAAEGNEFV